MNNMKKGLVPTRKILTLILGALLLFSFFKTGLAFDGQTHGERPSFLQTNENIGRIINNSIFVTFVYKEKYHRKFPIADKIYFTDKNRNVIKKIDFFPKGSKGINGDLFTYNSKKFIVADRFYDFKNKEISDNVIMDLNGNVLFKTQNNPNIFISDS
jgi:hypothetical protein